MRLKPAASVTGVGSVKRCQIRRMLSVAARSLPCMSEERGVPKPGSEPSSAGMAHAHDRYFRAGLQGRPEQAALVGELFPGLMPFLDAVAFETVDGTFVDEELRERQTDVVLRTRLSGRDVFIYVLVEHQRTVDPLMAVRMMRYQTRIWDRHLARHPGATRVPVILPAVVYQGERTWTAATDLRDILDLDPTSQQPQWSSTCPGCGTGSTI